MTDTPSLPAAQECWGLFDASGNLMWKRGRPVIHRQRAWLARWYALELSEGYRLLPGRFVPDDAKEPNHD